MQSLVNKLIQEEKLKYAIPVYNLNYLNMSSEDIAFTINDGNFLEMLLLRQFYVIFIKIQEL